MEDCEHVEIMGGQFVKATIRGVEIKGRFNGR